MKKFIILVICLVSILFSGVLLGQSNVYAYDNDYQNLTGDECSLM